MIECSYLFYFIYFFTIFIMLKNKISTSSLLLLGLSFYFLPLIYGADIYKDNFSKTAYYLAAYIFTASLLFCTTLNHVANKPLETISSQRGFYGPFLGFGSFLIVVYLFYRYGISGIFIAKRDSEIGGIDLLIWRNIASLAFVYGFLSKERTSLWGGGFALSLSFFSNDRTGPVTAILAILLLLFWGRRPIDIIIKEKTKVLFLFFLSGIMVIGKLIHAYINALAIGVVSNGTLEFDIQHSLEPFATQAILNRILHSNFSIGFDYLMCAPFMVLPSFGYCKYSTDIFNIIIQDKLFPDISGWGIAYNYWAEGYAIGGWLGLSIWLAIWLFVAYFLFSLIKSKNPALRSTTSLMFVYWVFYIHRNSLFSIISYEKQLLVFFFITSFFAAVSRYIFRVGDKKK